MRMKRETTLIKSIEQVNDRKEKPVQVLMGCMMEVCLNYYFFRCKCHKLLRFDCNKNSEGDKLHKVT